MAGAIKRKDTNGGARHSLDKFYTKTEHAAYCIQTVQELITNADIIIEPSAGSGAFSNQIDHPDLRAYDLHPEHPNIIRQDWFHTECETDRNLLVIGNPPFGVRSDLAKRFIQQAVKLNAHTIAFILPQTFSKTINQKHFPETYRLAVEEELPTEAFTLEGESFHIPARWYVWTKDENYRPGVDLRKQTIPDNPAFQFMRRESPEADFVLNGNSGKVKRLHEVTNPKAEHYIRITDRKKVQEELAKFTQLKFNFNSTVNGGVAWVGKQEILNAYNQHQL